MGMHNGFKKNAVIMIFLALFRGCAGMMLIVARSIYIFVCDLLNFNLGGCMRQLLKQGG